MARVSTHQRNQPHTDPCLHRAGLAAPAPCVLGHPRHRQGSHPNNQAVRPPTRYILPTNYDEFCQPSILNVLPPIGLLSSCVDTSFPYDVTIFLSLVFIKFTVSEWRHYPSSDFTNYTVYTLHSVDINSIFSNQIKCSLLVKHYIPLYAILTSLLLFPFFLITLFHLYFYLIDPKSNYSTLIFPLLK